MDNPCEGTYVTSKTKRCTPRSDITWVTKNSHTYSFDFEIRERKRGKQVTEERNGIIYKKI